ncbi:GmrSD restriction endonuclease domain-containing protein [Spirosoma areae]
MATLDNLSKNYATLVQEIESGQIKIPQFQRNFVWEKAQSAQLLDSMLKGYPIGTFIFWRTDEELRAVRNIGNIELPKQGQNEFVNYVLDGQQRITSFFAAVKGSQVERDRKRIDDFSTIYVDLSATQDQEIVTADLTNREANTCMGVSDLMSSSYWKKLSGIPEQYHDKVDQYRNLLTGYQFNIILLKNASISVATEVFTRLNVGGKALSLFEIMVAKTYLAPDHAQLDSTGFDLAVRYEQLLADLRSVQYDTLAPATVMQTVAMLAVKGSTRKQILDINKQTFIATWPRAVKSIKLAVDFLRDYGIPVSQLLPYNALLVPLSYFFDQHPTRPAGDMLRRLEDYFWRCSLGTRYSSSVEAKLASDVDKIDRILANEQPRYEWSVDVSPESLARVGWFSASRSYIKAILCLLAKQHPRSFKTGLNVRIDNAWLSKSTSKNYHHFFPKAFVKKQFPTIDYWRINHIANITIVDDYLNKNDIRAKSPARYIGDFSQENHEMSQTLATHLIGDVDEFGIASNDYERFFNARLLVMSKLLGQFLISQATDNQIQVEDNEEMELVEAETIDE